MNVNCRVLRFTFLSDRCKALSFSKIRWGDFYSFCLRFIFMWHIALKTNTLWWRQGEGWSFRFLFLLPSSSCAPRASSSFRNEGEGKVKACLHLFLHRNDLILNSFSGGVKGEGKKRKLADVRVHACARGESWGSVSETRLVFFDSPRVLGEVR